MNLPRSMHTFGVLGGLGAGQAAKPAWIVSVTGGKKEDDPPALFVMS